MIRTEKIEEDDLYANCLVLMVDQSLYSLFTLANYILIILFTYLSVKFSEPIEDYRDKFLLMFQTNDLQKVS